jgi:hypothetical protein
MFTRRTSNRGGPPRLGRADRPVENVRQCGGVAHGRQLHAPGSVVVRLGSWNGTKDRRDINTCMVNAATHMVFITGCRSSRGRYIEEMPEKADSQAGRLGYFGVSNHTPPCTLCKRKQSANTLQSVHRMKGPVCG